MKSVLFWVYGLAIGAALGLFSAWLVELAWNTVALALRGPRIDYLGACMLCLLLVVVGIALIKTMTICAKKA